MFIYYLLFKDRIILKDLPFKFKIIVIELFQKDELIFSIMVGILTSKPMNNGCQDVISEIFIHLRYFYVSLLPPFYSLSAWRGLGFVGHS